MQFSERLEKIINEKNISKYKIAKELGISQSTIANWTTGKANPTVEKLAELIQLIGVSADYLLTGKEGETITEDDKRILKLYKATTGERREYIDTMLAKTENELTQAESNSEIKDEAI